MDFILLISNLSCDTVKKRKSRAVNSAYSGYYEGKTHSIGHNLTYTLAPHGISHKRNMRCYV
jgi:hypothetical protein